MCFKIDFTLRMTRIDLKQYFRQNDYFPKSEKRDYYFAKSAKNNIY